MRESGKGKFLSSDSREDLEQPGAPRTPTSPAGEAVLLLKSLLEKGKYRRSKERENT